MIAQMKHLHERFTNTFYGSLQPLYLRNFLNLNNNIYKGVGRNSTFNYQLRTYEVFWKFL